MHKTGPPLKKRPLKKKKKKERHAKEGHLAPGDRNIPQKKKKKTQHRLYILQKGNLAQPIIYNNKKTTAMRSDVSNGGGMHILGKRGASGKESIRRGGKRMSAISDAAKARSSGMENPNVRARGKETAPLSAYNKQS